MSQMNLDFIKNEEMRNFGNYVITTRPNYFKTSSTRMGKWHPKDEYRPYGNKKHITRVLRVIEHLITDYEGSPRGTPPLRTLPDDDKALLYLAALIHDINKSTKKASASTGPNVVAQDLHTFFGRGWATKGWTGKLVELVAIHGGAFYPPSHVNKNIYTYNPADPLHFLLHTADYIASRNDINIDTKYRFGGRNWHNPIWWWSMRAYLWLLFK